MIDLKLRFYWNIRNLYQTELKLLLDLVLPGFTLTYICLRSHCTDIPNLEKIIYIGKSVSTENNDQDVRRTYLTSLRPNKTSFAANLFPATFFFLFFLFKTEEEYICYSVIYSRIPQIFHSSALRPRFCLFTFFLQASRMRIYISIEKFFTG